MPPSADLHPLRRDSEVGVVRRLRRLREYSGVADRESDPGASGVCGRLIQKGLFGILGTYVVIRANGSRPAGVSARVA
jgi:hypothetical protein